MLITDHRKFIGLISGLLAIGLWFHADPARGASRTQSPEIEICQTCESHPQLAQSRRHQQSYQRQRRRQQFKQQQRQQIEAAREFERNRQQRQQELELRRRQELEQIRRRQIEVSLGGARQT
jgi:hypothetical protein